MEKGTAHVDLTKDEVHHRYWFSKEYSRIDQIGSVFFGLAVWNALNHEIVGMAVGLVLSFICMLIEIIWGDK